MQAKGEMLRLARQLQGFHQIEAARLLGVDQSLLSRMENDVAEIREETILSASRVYEVQASFFYQTDPIYGAPVSVHPMWRKKADVAARELDTVVAEINVRLMHVRRFMEAADIASAHELPRLDIEDYGDPKEIAAVVRGHWQIPRGPIKDLTVLIERAGVLIAHSKMGGASISGVTFSTPGLPPLIALNSDQPADRLRFTLAHELGHLVMHRFPSRDMENEANQFASHLLMPDQDIAPNLRARKIDLKLLASLKPEWRVSMQSIIMKSKSLGLLNRNQEEYLWKQMSARKWRLREPAELDFAPEKPSVITNLVKIYKEHLGYSDIELAKLLHVSPARIDEYYPNAEKALKSKFTIIG